MTNGGAVYLKLFKRNFTRTFNNETKKNHICA